MGQGSEMPIAGQYIAQDVDLSEYRSCDIKPLSLSRRLSQGSESVTMEFLMDDRLQERKHNCEDRIEEYKGGEENYVKQYESASGRQHSNSGYSIAWDLGYQRQSYPEMAVDYSSQDFHHSLAAIDAASRDGIRVRQHGDTTIMTEHRDPYSFYWQLDQARHEVESPPRRLPPADYVIDEEEIVETMFTPESHDSGVAFENQYSRPLRHVQPLPVIERDDEVKPLPPGWEKHQDPSGFSYYWHVDSGTIQRDPPHNVTPPHSPLPPPAPMYSRTSLSRETQVDSPSTQVVQLPPIQPVIEEHAFKQTTTKRRLENSQENNSEEEYGHGKPIRFAVRSLGWIEIAEEELTAERSSRAVNKAIVDLSIGRNDVLDNVSKWGDGRELILELNDNELALIDPDTMTVVHSEMVHQIRVWGVGRDNGRDFAYVARDRHSRRFMCHVFRCDTPAKTIASTLRDICKRLMLHRRPTNLHGVEGSGERRVISRTDGLPIPNEEPKKIIRCHFLGVTQVPRATGIEILNEAVDQLVSQVRPERWILSNVSIAPSTITIVEVSGNQIAQCRVRYLSFLGIGRDIKHCAFIMHTSSESFMCYVFHVEPSAATMAKTIEAACKLRYQKVLDAHANRQIGPQLTSSSSLPGKGWTESLRDALETVTQRITPSRSSGDL